MTAQIIYLDQFAVARSHITSGNPTIREAAADVLAASTDPHDAWLVYQARRATWRREIREPLPHFADLRDGDGRWFMDTLHIIGAAATGDDGPTEVFDRDGLAALIGARFVDGLEQSREEYWA